MSPERKENASDGGSEPGASSTPFFTPCFTPSITPSTSPTYAPAAATAGVSDGSSEGSGRPGAAARRRVSIRVRLLWLVAACVVPVWIAAGFLVYYNYQGKRALMELRMMDTARALTMVVDRELAGVMKDASALAASKALVAGDLPEFHREAQSFARTHPVNILISDADGQRFLSTLRPFGSPMPKRAEPEISQKIFATGQPTVSNVFEGTLMKRFLVTVDVPVFRDGKVIYDLSMSMNSDRFADILRQQRIPSGWQGLIFDSRQVEIASSRPGNSFVGRQVSYEPGRLGQRMRDNAEGVTEAANLDGKRMVSGFSRSATTGWSVVIGVPKDIFMAEIQRGLIWAIAGTVLLSLLGLALAFPIWRRVEQTEREASKLSAIVESSDDAIIGSRLEGVIESWNRGAERLFGYTAQEVVGRQLSILVPDELQAGLAERSRRVSEGESIEPFVTTRKHKDGRLIPVEIKISSVINSEGTIVRRAAMVRDLTERMRVERALAESEEKLRAVVELAPDAVFMASQGRFFMVNQAACDQLGYSREQLMQLKVRDIVAPRFVENVVSRLNGKLLPGVHESAHLRADGVEVPVEANFAKILFRGELIVMGIARDISARKRAEAERKELEELLHQAQKMEAVGRLAGGVAHEFNNLLMVIQSYAETLHEELPAYGGLRNNTREIVKAVARASSLTHQMLAFSRKQVLTPALLDLNAVIRDAAKMLTRLIGEDVELQTKPGAGLWAVEADAGQIVQMLMNLTANARDAMPRGGQLTITTGNLSVEKGIAGARESLVPGDYAWLSVADTGMGFSSEVKEHIFEPFFTTKEVGQGTGLGLATVYGIVKQSGGYIHAYGEPGKGACFTIYLPRAMGTVPVAAAVKAEAAPTGAETLLVVEDEEAVRQVICEYLRRQGYAVLSAENTQQALAVAGECKGMIDPLITDLVMPGQSGLELARKLTGLRPGMKTIYMSGHADDAIARHGVDRMEAIFLQKPFSMSTLARKVREALNEAGTVQ